MFDKVFIVVVMNLHRLPDYWIEDEGQVNFAGKKKQCGCFPVISNVNLIFWRISMDKSNQSKVDFFSHAIPDSKIEEALNATQNNDGIHTVERLKQLSSEEVLACLTANCCHDGMPK